jgi:hypothetical protein
MSRCDEEVDVAFVVFEWFWPTIAFGEVFDCAELAHRVYGQVLRVKILGMLWMGFFERISRL